MAKRNYVVDYEIVGSLVIEASSPQQAAWIARGCVIRFSRELDSASDYFEADVSQPVDMQQRINPKAA